MTETKTTLTLSNGSTSKSVDLYSEEGVELLSDLWLKVSMEFKRMHRPTWFGTPIIQLPEDIVQVQELLWKVQPDRVVEAGIAHGGSLVFISSLLKLMGDGKVLGIDVEIREHNREKLDVHPMRDRIELLESSSISDLAVQTAKDFIGDAQKVVIFLDSNHSTDHVAQELELYAPMIPSGSYLVAMDGAQAFLHDVPRGNPEWIHDNPLTAIKAFLEKHPEFEVDEHFTRLDVTTNPMAYLRRK